MKTASPILAGVILALATTVVPRVPERTDPVATDGDVGRLTGELTFPVTGTGTGEFGKHALQWRGAGIRADLQTNDARLSGDLLLNWNCDVFLPDYVNETSGAITTGAVVVLNDGGSWEGVWRGLTYPDNAGGQHHTRLTGVGPFEEYAALLYLTVVRGDLVVDGLVFPGEMPPVPESPV